MNKPDKPALYALRRTIPSWCFEEKMDELIGFCKFAHIDEVIVKVDTEEFTHGIPKDPLYTHIPLFSIERR